MENRHADFYEQDSPTRLKNILDVIIYTLRPYGGSLIESIIQQSSEIIANITWDGYKTIDANGMTNFLEKINRTLLKLEPMLDKKDFEKIQRINEPLEIVIAEIKLAYAD